MAKHGSLTRRDVRLAVVASDLIGDQGVFGADSQDRTASNGAILALVGRLGRDHNHLTLGWSESALSIHQGVVVSHKGAELVRPISEHKEDFRNKAGFLLHLEDSGADVLWYRVKLRPGVAADRGLGHFAA